ncbi:MAG: putative nitrogen regulatory PII-like protein [Methanomassiliicoccales archaeon PtaU1.Bin030]|nr:MAG: putative nitrogen regulatory PII-like protein [Methanomassiliicoccales archaeon PtaU1.Bin030]
MKKIEAVIRHEKLNQVKAALESVDISGMTVQEVRGRGEQKGLEFINRAGKYRVDLLPKMLVTIVVPDNKVAAIVDALIHGARTGEIGDGKIFVSEVERCIRIRTGEEGDEAL